MASSEAIQFSSRQQAALLGHALRDPRVWEVMIKLGPTDDWLVDAGLRTVLKHGMAYTEAKGSPPSSADLRDYVYLKETSVAFAAFESRLKMCAEAYAELSVDHLNQKLLDWGKVMTAKSTVKAAVAAYNRGEHVLAVQEVERGADRIRLIEAGLATGGDRLVQAEVRSRAEANIRAEAASKPMFYGVKYLDDALYGIHRDEMVLIGGRTGAGKTELARIIAKTNAEQGRKVAAFVLEAVEGEYEMRIKYQMIAERFYQENGVEEGKGLLSYAEWYRNRLEGTVGKYVKDVDAEFEAKYKTLKTYYKVSQHFGPEDLEREMYRIREEADIVVVDHFHYLDEPTSGVDANVAATRAAKTIRNLVQAHQIPTVLVAHLNKAARHSLVPEIDDFMGSSNLGKIATTAIVVARADRAVAVNDPRVSDGVPTFIGIPKCRLDGARTSVTGLTVFDPNRNKYEEYYAVGRVGMRNDSWKVLDKAPRWAHPDHLLREVSEVEAS